MENLKLVESVLDGLIKSCSQQLFQVTDNLENAAYPFCVPPNETRIRCHIRVQLQHDLDSTEGSGIRQVVQMLVFFNLC